MTPDQIKDAEMFFTDSRNCERHPVAAQRKGIRLIAEVRDLRAALDRIHRHSFATEESATTWKDVAVAQASMAETALKHRAEVRS